MAPAISNNEIKMVIHKFTTKIILMTSCDKKLSKISVLKSARTVNMTMMEMMDKIIPRMPEVIVPVFKL